MKAVVFSGTSDGNEICRFLSENSIETVVCTATEYGGSLINKMPYVTIHTGRMNIDEMKEIINGVDFVIDATHPYATEVTKNIKKACENIKYLRLLREEEKVSEVIEVADIKEAVNFLKNTKGNIFVATGSKEIEKFCEIENYKKRVYARVLDTESVREKCESYGFLNILYKRPPFSYEDNLRDLKMANAKYMVTKNSGKEGGFIEKINSAKKLGVEIILIKRPYEESGFFMEDMKNKILKIKRNC